MTDQRYKIINADCIEAMRAMEPESVDAVVTDPPYGFGFMGKEWDAEVPPVEAWLEVLRVMKPGAYLIAFGGAKTYHRLAASVEDAGAEIRDQLIWLYGGGMPKHATHLKPAHEPMVMARKAFKGSLKSHMAATGLGGLNIEACRVPADDGDNRARPPRGGNEIYGGGNGTNTTASQHNEVGRYPHNVMHDGSDAVLGIFPETTAGGSPKARKGMGYMSSAKGGDTENPQPPSTGSAARYFYCAKASPKDLGPNNTHPTVKPTTLMQYLCRLVTPPNGVILDPFMGSGSTGVAAMREGFRFIGIDRESEYCEIARRRIELASSLKAT